MEILKSHFSEAEIQEIQELPDYEETRLKVERMQADSMLDDLESRIGENIKSAKTLQEKWNIFKASLENKENGSLPITPEDWKRVGEEGLEGAKEKLKKGVEDIGEDLVDSAGEVVKTKADKLTGGFFSKLGFGEILSELKNKINIGGIFKSILASILGALGLSRFLKKDEILESETSEEGTETPIIEQDKGEEGEINNPDINEGSDNLDRWNTTKKGVYESTGYRIIAIQSGIKEKNNQNATGIYSELGEKTLSEIHKIFVSTNKKLSGKLKNELGIEANISDQELENVIIGIIGPFQSSFLQPTVGTLASLKEILFSSENKLHTGVSDVFSREEISFIKNMKYDFRKLPLSYISRLVSLYWKSLGGYGLSYLSTTTQKIGTEAINFLFGENISHAIGTLKAKTETSKIFPEKVASLFKDITDARGYIGKSGNEIRETFGSEVEFTEAEIRQIDSFLEFVAEARKEIPQRFDFGMPEFNTAFEEKIDFGNLASLYLLIQGNQESSVAFSQFDANQELLVYGWLISILGEHQLSYVTAIFHTLKEDSDTLSENASNILLVLSYRIIEGQRNGIIQKGENIVGAVHDNIIHSLPNWIPDEYKNGLAYLIELVGGVGLWKALGYINPTIRALGFIATGLGIAALYYFSGEAVYRGLNTIRKQRLNTFLEAHFSEVGDADTIRKSLHSEGGISITDVYRVGDDAILEIFKS